MQLVERNAHDHVTRRRGVPRRHRFGNETPEDLNRILKRLRIIRARDSGDEIDRPLYDDAGPIKWLPNFVNLKGHPRFVPQGSDFRSRARAQVEPIVIQHIVNRLHVDTIVGRERDATIMVAPQHLQTFIPA